MIGFVSLCFLAIREDKSASEAGQLGRQGTRRERSKLKVVGKHLQLLESRQDNDAASSGPPSRAAASSRPSGPASAGRHH